MVLVSIFIWKSWIFVESTSFCLEALKSWDSVNGAHCSKSLIVSIMIALQLPDINGQRKAAHENDVN